MKNIHRKTFFLFILLCTVITVSAQQTARKMIEETDYLLYLPEGYEADTTKQWPMIIFLHGAGETGTGIERVKIIGLPRNLADGRQYPFIIASPQSPTHGWKPDEVMKLYDHLVKEFRVDNNRIYLTGLSMGGYGTWRTLANYADYFAAAIPICGGGSPMMAENMKNIPIWCFHGDADDVVKISESQKMVDALEAIGGNIRFTVYPGVGHDSWTQTYNNDSIYDWLLSHKRFENVLMQMSAAELEEYTGTYHSEKRNVDLNITVDGEGLLGSFNGSNLPKLFPTDKDKFYYNRYARQYITFERNEKGKITAVQINQDRFVKR